jgi:sulfide:quinone oxidoreductase
VGSGLKQKTALRRRLADIIPPHISLRPENVASFNPESSSVTTTSGNKVNYEILVVAAGLQVKYDGIAGLQQALADPNSGVSTIYSYDTCDKTWGDIESIRTGKAVFTQPAGVIKCAGGQ